MFIHTVHIVEGFSQYFLNDKEFLTTFQYLIFWLLSAIPLPESKAIEARFFPKIFSYYKLLSVTNTAKYTPPNSQDYSF